MMKIVLLYHELNNFFLLIILQDKSHLASNVIRVLFFFSFNILKTFCFTICFEYQHTLIYELQKFSVIYINICLLSYANTDDLG